MEGEEVVSVKDLSRNNDDGLSGDREHDDDDVLDKDHWVPSEFGMQSCYLVK